MTLQKNIVLAVVFAVICALIFQVEIPRDEKEQSRGVLFSGLTKSDVERVEIAAKSGVILLSNAGLKVANGTSEEISPASWRLEGQEWTEVNTATLGTLLSSLLAVKLESPIPAEETEADRSVYGLEKPETVIKVTAKGKTTELLLGKMNSYVSKRYVSVAGEPTVYLVTDTLSATANRELLDFRNTKPISFSDSSVSSIEIDRKPAPVRLSSKNGLWRVEQPFPATGGKNEISELLSNLRSLSAMKFLNTSESEALGLNKPDAVVTLNFSEKDAKPLVVRFKSVIGEEMPTPLPGGKKMRGANQAVFAIEGRPGIFKTGDDSSQRFLAELDTFREKELFKFDIFEVEGIVIKHSQGEVLDLVRKEKDWTVNGEKGDTAFIDQLSNNLASLRAEAFPKANGANDSLYGFDKPLLVATVRLKTAVAPEGEEKATLQSVERVLYVGKAVSDGKAQKGKGKEKTPQSAIQYYAAVGDRTEPFIISQDSFKKISPHKETLVKIEVATPSPTPK